MKQFKLKVLAIVALSGMSCAFAVTAQNGLCMMTSPSPMSLCKQENVISLPADPAAQESMLARLPANGFIHIVGAVNGAPITMSSGFVSNLFNKAKAVEFTNGVIFPSVSLDDAWGVAKQQQVRFFISNVPTDTTKQLFSNAQNVAMNVQKKNDVQAVIAGVKEIGSLTHNSYSFAGPFAAAVAGDLIAYDEEIADLNYVVGAAGTNEIGQSAQLAQGRYMLGFSKAATADSYQVVATGLQQASELPPVVGLFDHENPAMENARKNVLQAVLAKRSGDGALITNWLIPENMMQSGKTKELALVYIGSNKTARNRYVNDFQQKSIRAFVARDVIPTALMQYPYLSFKVNGLKGYVVAHNKEDLHAIIQRSPFLEKAYSIAKKHGSSITPQKAQSQVLSDASVDAPMNALVGSYVMVNEGGTNVSIAQPSSPQVSDLMATQEQDLMMGETEKIN